ncbi:hypothetical protein MYSE111917_21025 [Mycobacterium senriense]
MPGIELPYHASIVPYPGHRLYKDPQLCAQRAVAGTQQPRIWSSTIPVACISA